MGSDAHADYTRVLENVRSMCSRNEKTQSQLLAEKNLTANGTSMRRRGGYYLGSRKISLTCHSPIVESNTVSKPIVTNNNNNSKLDVKRKIRLRSPVPSPPTISPSSSPNRSRFQVSRVAEVSPLTSPLAQTPPSHAHAPLTSSSSVNIPRIISTSLPTSSSLPSMATVTSSTQSIKRHSVSPRSRFHVSKIYEDPKLPLASRPMPPITPPLVAPPTPMTKTAPKIDEIAKNVEENAKKIPVASNVIDALINTSQKDVGSNNSANITQTTVLDTVSSFDKNNSIIVSSSEVINSITFTSNDNSNLLFSTSSNCPITSINDNDITLTNNTVCEALSNAVAAAVSSSSGSSTSSSSTSDASLFGEKFQPTLPTDITDTLCSENSTNSQLQQQQQQQRTRKVSWISNPAAVDKLLTLFHKPTNLFQRPEPKSVTHNVPVQSKYCQNHLYKISKH